MIIYYDDVTLDVTHIVTSWSQDYEPTTNGEHFIIAKQPMSFERVFLDRDASGGVVIGKKADMPIVASDVTIKLGETAIFAVVPDGAAVIINGAASGTMDTSGVLDFEPSTTGFFKIAFSRKGYMTREFSLEVVSSN